MGAARKQHKGRKVPGGRGLYDFARIVDTYGSEITVRSSSSPGHVWIFTKRDGKEYADHPPSQGGISVISPHLNLKQAKLLRDALDRFLAWDCQ
jgi:hypothetical protein